MQWAEKSLQQRNAGRRTAVGNVAAVAEVANARTVDAVEDVKLPIMSAMDGMQVAWPARIAGNLTPNVVYWYGWRSSPLRHP